MEENLFSKVQKLEEKKETILHDLSLALTDKNTNKHYSLRAKAYKKINAVDATIAALFSEETQERINFLEDLIDSVAVEIQEEIETTRVELEYDIVEEKR